MRAHRTIAAHSGHSLVEVLVALVLVTTGTLAVVATGAALVTLGGSAALRTTAAERIAATADSLRATPCSLLRAGTDTAFRIAVAWNVVPAARARSVTITARGGMASRSFTLASETLLPCD